MNKQRAIVPPVYGFIITKPLQLMVVMTIIEQLPDEIIKELIVIDAFFGAKKIVEELTISNPKWQRTVFFENSSAAFRHCIKLRYDSLFLDSDVGFRKNIDLIRLKLSTPKTRIAVYEEGLGSYRNDIYYGARKRILSLIGVGVHFGGNWLTKEIYLFQPSDYINNCLEKTVDVILIKMVISQLILKYEIEFDELFKLAELKSYLTDASSNNVCDIYLTSWSWSSEAIKRLKQSDSCRIVKFHPHIKEVILSSEFQFDVSVPPEIPAEILITIASKIFKNVRVLHHGSSVVRYLNLKNVNFELMKSNEKLRVNK